MDPDFEKILIRIGRLLFLVFRKYFEIIEATVQLIIPHYRRPAALAAVLKEIDGGSGNIDDRIKKIDQARDNLQDAIAAIDELRSQADINKRDLSTALDRIREAEQQKEVLGKQLEALKQVAEADTEAFRQIVGIPSKTGVWKERLLGFCSGILASVIASFVYLVIAKALRIT